MSLPVVSSSTVSWTLYLHPPVSRPVAKINTQIDKEITAAEIREMKSEK